MGMGEKNVKNMSIFFDQFVSKPSDPGAGINNDQVSASGSYLQTSRVTTIFDILFSTNRNRTS
jgi:hypothetical protein